MTIIKYSVDKPQMALRLTARGHAGAGVAGKDIVCSAVTILIRTLASVVTDMHEIHMLARPPTIDLDSGTAVVACRLNSSLGYAEAKVRYDTVYKGLCLLAETFPKHVKIIK